MKLKRFFWSVFRRPLPISIAFLTCFIGYSSVYFYAYYQHKFDATKTNYLVISKLDNLLTNLDSIAISTAVLKQPDCQLTRPQLNNIIKTDHIPITITIIKNNQLYCSSDQALTLEKLPPIRSHYVPIKENNLKTYLLYWNNNLYLKEIVSPEKTILINTSSSDELQRILTETATPKVVKLQLGNINLTSHGVLDSKLKLYNKIHAQSLQNYNYKLTTGNLSSMSALIIRKYYKSLLLIALIATTLYMITNYFIRKRSSAYHELKEAIYDNQIVPYLQPVLDSQTGKLAGAEVLARWIHPEVGLIAPDRFIPMAEDTGLIIPLTQILFEQTAQAFIPYANKLPNNFRIGFNISRSHCKSLKILDDCKIFYKKINTPNITLVLEITERQPIEVTETTKHLFKELHKIGVQIALDDFGVGNSNLSYLNDFAIDYLKIDKSFIARIGSDALSKHILDTIIDITQQCKIESCAEGIETKEQWEYIKTKSVDYVQGYYFARPLSIEEFINAYVIPYSQDIT